MTIKEVQKLHDSNTFRPKMNITTVAVCLVFINVLTNEFFQLVFLISNWICFTERERDPTAKSSTSPFIVNLLCNTF